MQWLLAGFGTVLLGVVANAAYGVLRNGLVALRNRQASQALAAQQSIEERALSLAVDQQRMTAWVGVSVVSMLTVLMLLMAEVFICFTIAFPDRFTWLGWICAALSFVAALFGYRIIKVLDKVWDALATDPNG